jgi:hypothetical protein
MDSAALQTRNRQTAPITGRGARLLVSWLLGASCSSPIFAATATTGLTVAKVATVDTADGKRLFNGQTPIPARLLGHAEVLPAPTARCSNCHAITPPSIPRASSFAPVLDAPSLLNPLSRRGGPPSKFDAASLCKLLREGIDPAWIVLPTTMPRYTISDLQCSALWSFLVRQK